MTDDRIQRSDVGGQMTEFRGQKDGEREKIEVERVRR